MQRSGDPIGAVEVNLNLGRVRQPRAGTHLPPRIRGRTDDEGAEHAAGPDERVRG